MRSRAFAFLLLTLAACGAAPEGRELEPPVSVPVKLPFGPYFDPRFGLAMIHQGLRYECDPGVEVRAVAPGIVTLSGDASSYGLVVVVDGDDGWRFLYANLADLHVSVGDRVSARDLIANEAPDCARGGVYFGIWRDKPVDPSAWLAGSR